VMEKKGLFVVLTCTNSVCFCLLSAAKVYLLNCESKVECSKGVVD
jgi:hypothetical protein